MTSSPSICVVWRNITVTSRWHICFQMTHLLRLLSPSLLGWWKASVMRFWERCNCSNKDRHRKCLTLLIARDAMAMSNDEINVNSLRQSLTFSPRSWPSLFYTMEVFFPSMVQCGPRQKARGEVWWVVTDLCKKENANSNNNSPNHSSTSDKCHGTIMPAPPPYRRVASVLLASGTFVNGREWERWGLVNACENAAISSMAYLSRCRRRRTAATDHTSSKHCVLPWHGIMPACRDHERKCLVSVWK